MLDADDGPRNRKLLVGADDCRRRARRLALPCEPPSAGNEGLDPMLAQQPPFDDLRKIHVAEQREQEDWPVQWRQVREP